jgi:hypothetical protein
MFSRCARGHGRFLRARRQFDESAFERVGEQQPAGDAGDDQRDIPSAEGKRDGGEVGIGSALLECGGEFLARNR